MPETFEQMLLWNIEEPKEVMGTVLEIMDNDNFLARLNAIEISVDSRISEVEAEYCQQEEAVFFETRDVLKNSLNLLSTLYKKYEGQKFNDREIGYLSTYTDLSNIEKRIDEIYSSFISRITGYFASRYNVSLSYITIKEKYDENSITYSIVLDEIFEQLGGLSFSEKAIEEIKIASRKILYNKDKAKITNNKLSIQDCVWWNSYCLDNRHEISWDDKRVTPLFQALTHFSTEFIGMNWRLKEIYEELRSGSNEYDIFSKYELNMKKLESLKIFKNGKVEIVFDDNTSAEAFKNEYLY